jgi:hypothetical protein
MSEIKTTSAERELQAAQAKLHDMSLHLVEASRAAEEWKLKCREANAYTDKAYAELDSWRLKAATAVGAASKLLDERDSLQARPASLLPLYERFFEAWPAYNPDAKFRRAIDISKMDSIAEEIRKARV